MRKLHLLAATLLLTAVASSPAWAITGEFVEDFARTRKFVFLRDLDRAVGLAVAAVVLLAAERIAVAGTQALQHLSAVERTPLAELPARLAGIEAELHLALALAHLFGHRLGALLLAFA